MKHFGSVHLDFAWPALHFRRVVLRVLHGCQGCVKWWQRANSVTSLGYRESLLLRRRRGIRCTSGVCGILFGVAHAVFGTLFTLYTLHTSHSTLYSSHFRLGNPHSTLYTLHSTLYTVHFTLFTLHSTLYSVHCTLHTLHCTLYTIQFKSHTLHLTLRNLQIDTPRSTL